MTGIRLLTTSLAASLVLCATLVDSKPSPQPQNAHKSSSNSTDTPAFCNKLDCPEFKEVLKTKDYEIRDYASSSWVSTNLEGVSYDMAIGVMFMKLFNYISGKNARNETIAMTAPVLNQVIPGAGPACKSNFTMSFYISPSLKDPPKATDKTVVLTSLPPQRVYTRYFGGFAKESSYVQNAETLANALVRDSREFDSSYFFTAGYDSPFKILNRHNEVWYIAK